MADENLPARLAQLKLKIAETDRQRVQAEAAYELQQKQLTEVDEQIVALGVKPEKIDDQLTKLEAALAKEIVEIEAALAEESAAYAAILKAVR